MLFRCAGTTEIRKWGLGWCDLSTPSMILPSSLFLVQQTDEFVPKKTSRNGPNKQMLCSGFWTLWWSLKRSHRMGPSQAPLLYPHHSPVLTLQPAGSSNTCISSHVRTLALANANLGAGSGVGSQATSLCAPLSPHL